MDQPAEQLDREDVQRGHHQRVEARHDREDRWGDVARQVRLDRVVGRPGVLDDPFTGDLEPGLLFRPAAERLVVEGERHQATSSARRASESPSCLSPSFSTALPRAPVIIEPVNVPSMVTVVAAPDGVRVKAKRVLTPAMPVPAMTRLPGASTVSTVHSSLFFMPSMRIFSTSRVPEVRVVGGSSIQPEWMVNQFSQVSGLAMVSQIFSGEALMSRLRVMSPMGVAPVCGGSGL